MSRSRVLGGVVLAAALAAGGAAPPAAAHDHEPPRTVLEAGPTTQRGRLGSSCWIYPVDGGYVQHCIDRIPQWPRIERAPSGIEATVVVRKAARPAQVVLEYWRRVDAYGFPIGRPRRLAVALGPRMYAGEPAWELAFRLPEDPGPIYLRLFGIWFDEEVAPDEPQDAEWRFRLRLG